MRNLTVPPDWAQFVKNSSELVTTEQFDLMITWFEGQDDPSAGTILETDSEASPVSNPHQAINRSQADTASNEGDRDDATLNRPQEDEEPPQSTNKGDLNTISFQTL